MQARGERIRGALARAAVAAAAVGLGCTLALERSGQCVVQADCQALDPSSVCGADGVCVPLVSSVRGISGPTGNECRADADCAGAASPAVCRDGFCRAVEREDGRCILLGGSAASLAEGPDVMLVGLLSSAEELGLGAPTSLERPRQPSRGVATAVSLALAELNRARLGSALSALPPLAAVACNENDPSSLEYLLDALRVRVIVGPTSSERIELALLRTQNGALLLPPFADGPDLEPNADDSPGLLLGCRPNRRAIRAYLLDAAIEARRYIEAAIAGRSLNPALLVSSDVATASFADGIDGAALAAAGVRRLSYGDMTGGDLVSVLEAAQPPVDLVIAASMEDDWAAHMAAYDAAYFERQLAYPYYLLGLRRASVLDPTLADQSTDPPRALRFLGLDYERGALSQEALAEFSRSQLESEGPPEPELGSVYDCTYVAVYAALAASLRLRRPLLELRADAILTGLGALQGGSTPRLVGPRDAAAVVAALLAERGLDGAVELVGASGELDFELEAANDPATLSLRRRYFGVTPPNGELYCVDAVRQALCETGIVFSPVGGPPVRTSDRCACLLPR